MSKKTLLSKGVARLLTTDVAFAEYHGANPGYLGTGMINYALAYSLKAKSCLCIGSGGGFVPMILSQAQVDAGVDRPQTTLVDANLPAAGSGDPRGRHGWLGKDSALTRHYPKIVIKIQESFLFFREAISKGVAFDLIHIDGDHSYAGCRGDLEYSTSCLSKAGVVTVHDTRYSSIQRALADFLEHHQDFGIIDFRDLAQGLAIIRRHPEDNCHVRYGRIVKDPEGDVSLMEQNSSLTYPIKEQKVVPRSE